MGGKPPVEDFINDVEESLSGSTGGSHWSWFKKYLKDDKVHSQGKGFEFYRDESAELVHARNLLNSTLNWRVDDRISIDEIIEHPFVKDCRLKNKEKLPPPKLVDKVKSLLNEVEDEIKKYEDAKDYDGLLNNCIKAYVAKVYGYDKDVQDHYSYSTSGEGPI